MNILYEYATIIGLDWADKKHDICLKYSDSGALEFSILRHSAEAIDAWAMALHERFPGQSIAVCIESRKVPLIYALLKYNFLVLLPINPQTVARYRRALRPSRAKDDPTDAQLPIDLVLRHEGRFKPWVPERPGVRSYSRIEE